jgi:hypothetical protein
MSDDSWLEYDEEPQKKLPIPVDNEQRRELVKTLFALTWKQRAFVKALHATQLDERAAREQLKVKASTLLRWKTEPAFARLLNLLQAIVADDVSLTRASVLARISKLADDTRKIVTRRDANGNEIEGPVDGSTARGALKDLATALNVLEPASTRVMVQIVDLSGDPEPTTIDARVIDHDPV